MAGRTQFGFDWICYLSSKNNWNIDMQILPCTIFDLTILLDWCNNLLRIWLNRSLICLCVCWSTFNPTQPPSTVVQDLRIFSFYNQDACILLENNRGISLTSRNLTFSRKCIVVRSSLIGLDVLGVVAERRGESPHPPPKSEIFDRSHRICFS